MPASRRREREVGIGGRKPKLSSEQQQLAKEMAQGGIAITKIAQTLQVSRHTIYKALAQAQAVVE